MNKRKILYVSGTRADYGLMGSILRAIHNHPQLELHILATGMHLMSEFGFSLNEIKKDKYPYTVVDAKYNKDSYESMAIFLGEFIAKATPIISSLKPSIILVLGDRAEMLGAALCGAYLNIPIAHVHGGDVSSTVDDLARHSITKLSHIHFPATKKSAQRILRMGEEKGRVHVVGSPSLDRILHEPKISREQLENILKIDLLKPTIVCIQHPVTEEVSYAVKQMQDTLEALKEIGCQTIILYPNADAGARAMISSIEKFRTTSHFTILKNLPYLHFISLLSYAKVLVGNSSSGIIEAASLKLPVVNIGTRQQGRERGKNVIDVDYTKEEIIKGIKKALSTSFQRKLDVKNLYGDGKTGERITTFLAKIALNQKLLQKAAP